MGAHAVPACHRARAGCGVPAGRLRHGRPSARRRRPRGPPAAERRLHASGRRRGSRLWPDGRRDRHLLGAKRRGPAGCPRGNALPAAGGRQPIFLWPVLPRRARLLGARRGGLARRRIGNLDDGERRERPILRARRRGRRRLLGVGATARRGPVHRHRRRRRLRVRPHDEGRPDLLGRRPLAPGRMARGAVLARGAVRGAVRRPTTSVRSASRRRGGLPWRRRRSDLPARHDLRACHDRGASLLRACRGNAGVLGRARRPARRAVHGAVRRLGKNLRPAPRRRRRLLDRARRPAAPARGTGLRRLAVRPARRALSLAGRRAGRRRAPRRPRRPRSGSGPAPRARSDRPYFHPARARPAGRRPRSRGRRLPVSLPLVQLPHTRRRRSARCRASLPLHHS